MVKFNLLIILWVAVIFWHSCLLIFTRRKVVLRFFQPETSVASFLYLIVLTCEVFINHTNIIFNWAIPCSRSRVLSASKMLGEKWQQCHLLRSFHQKLIDDNLYQKYNYKESFLKLCALIFQLHFSQFFFVSNIQTFSKNSRIMIRTSQNNIIPPKSGNRNFFRNNAFFYLFKTIIIIMKESFTILFTIVHAYVIALHIVSNVIAAHRIK